MNAKSILSSVTFWGVAISLLSKLLLAFGVFELEEGIQTELAETLAIAVPLLAGVVGDFVAIWGRINATAWIKPNALMKPTVEAIVRQEAPNVPNTK